jgi:hypothetical protein
METNLESIAAVVSEHRQGKKPARYPKAVWDAIGQLRKVHSVSEISKATGLGTTWIYRKTEGRRKKASFQEVKLPALPPTRIPVSFEVRRGDGSELRFRCDLSGQELFGFVSQVLK